MESVVKHSRPVAYYCRPAWRTDYKSPSKIISSASVSNQFESSQNGIKVFPGYMYKQRTGGWEIVGVW